MKHGVFIFCVFLVVCSCKFVRWNGSLDIRTVDDILRVASDDENCEKLILINKNENREEWYRHFSHSGSKTNLSIVAQGMIMLHYDNCFVVGYEKDSDIVIRDVSALFHKHAAIREVDFGDLDLSSVRTYDYEKGECFLQGALNDVGLKARNLRFPIIYMLDNEPYCLGATYVYGEETLLDSPRKNGQYQFTKWYENESSLKSNPRDLASDYVQSIKEFEYGVKRVYGRFNKYGRMKIDSVPHLSGRQIYKNGMEIGSAEVDKTNFFAGDSITIGLQPDIGFLVSEGDVKINGAVMRMADEMCFGYMVPENPPDSMDLSIIAKQYVEYNSLLTKNCTVNVTCNSLTVSQGAKLIVGNVIFIDVVPVENHAIDDLKSDSIIIDGNKPVKISENKYEYLITGNESLQFDISVDCEESWVCSLSSQKCSVRIKRNGIDIQSGAPLFKGDDLFLDIVPDDSCELQSVFLNDDSLPYYDGIFRYTVSGEELSHLLSFAVLCRKYTKLNVLGSDNCAVSVKRNNIALSASDSLYVGDELDISVTPDSNFIVESLKVNGRALFLENEWSCSYVVTGNEPKRLDVLIRTKKYICFDVESSDSCSFDIYRGSNKITSSDRLFLGDLIDIKVSPNDYHYTKSITANNHTSANQPEFQFLLDENDMLGTKLSVSVVTDNYHILSVTKPDGCSISILDGDGNEVISGMKCYNNSEIKIKLNNPDEYLTREVTLSGQSLQEFTSSNDYSVSHSVKQSDENIIAISIDCLDYKDYSSTGFEITNIKPYLVDAVEFTVSLASLWTSVTTGVGENSIRLCKDDSKYYLLLGSSISKIEETSYCQLFKDLSALKVIDLSRLSFDSCINVTEMFSGCSALETIYVLSMPSSPDYVYSTGTFAGCKKLSGKYSGGSCAFDANKTSGSYARIATSNYSQFGYFTKK